MQRFRQATIGITMSPPIRTTGTQPVLALLYLPNQSFVFRQVMLVLFWQFHARSNFINEFSVG